MLYAANERGLSPDYTVFDSWYKSLDSLKQLREMGWHWLARTKENRLVATDGPDFRAISDIEIPQQGRIVHLKDYA